MARNLAKLLGASILSVALVGTGTVAYIHGKREAKKEIAQKLERASNHSNEQLLSASGITDIPMVKYDITGYNNPNERDWIKMSKKGLLKERENALYHLGRRDAFGQEAREIYKDLESKK